MLDFPNGVSVKIAVGWLSSCLAEYSSRFRRNYLFCRYCQDREFESHRRCLNVNLCKISSEATKFEVMLDLAESSPVKENVCTIGSVFIGASFLGRPRSTQSTTRRCISYIRTSQRSRFFHPLRNLANNLALDLINLVAILPF